MMTTTSESTAIIYAELLSNIRQVSVVASLSCDLDSTTNAEVIDNGQVIRIHHQGHTQALTLPSQVSAPPVLPISQAPCMRLSWRLPLSPTVARPLAFSLETQALPWSSVDIKIGSQIFCRKCQHPIVKENTITAWKDLPSENWAEMMEFWHCHKPHDHAQLDDEELVKRGYGASNAISAQVGIGFVDLTSFMFSESDCNGLSVSNFEILHYPSGE